MATGGSDSASGIRVEFRQARVTSELGDRVVKKLNTQHGRTQSKSAEGGETTADLTNAESSSGGGAVRLEGWIVKRSVKGRKGKMSIERHFANFKRRYFILGSGLLRYYADESCADQKGEICLDGATVVHHCYSQHGENCIVVRSRYSKRRHVMEMQLKLESREQLQCWLTAIQKEIRSITHSSRVSLPRIESMEALSSYVRRVDTLESSLSSSATTSLANSLSSGSSGDAAATAPAAAAAAAAAAARLAFDIDDVENTTEEEEEEEEVHEILAPSTLPVPPMNIVILVVGTRGDVQPFTALGLRLQERGHRVRLATHAMHRSMVKPPLEFYPLGGDPVTLSRHMVKTQGRIIPDVTSRTELHDLSENMAMINEILHSTWPACTAADPEDPEVRAFVADAIISNPVTYGHIHCAEALCVPLHIMFPQPWTPTKAFPHPLANLPYSQGWSSRNYLSYRIVDEFMWAGTASMANVFRRQLGLEPIRRGEAGGDLLNDNNVPFAKMWSPALVPKPKDWGPHVDVVGNFFVNDSPNTSYTPAPELAQFLGLEGDESCWAAAASAQESPDRPQPPIFIGFGSMVIDDTASLTALIIAAATETGTRVVLQSSWSNLGEGLEIPDSVFLLGNCPHDWLFPHMAGVIHHGGAGTVAAGLRAGKPTMVMPFFGDQFFWAQMATNAGVGPAPCPISELTVEVLKTSLLELRSERLQSNAERMARAFAREDGVNGGLSSFYRHLPVEDMVCDVSVFLQSGTRIARYYCEELKMKLCPEVVDIVCGEEHTLHDYSFVDWGVVGPKNLSEGIAQGLSSAAHELTGALLGLVAKPVEQARAGAENFGVLGGIAGAAGGAATGLIDLIRRPLRGGVIMIDKVSCGLANKRNYEEKIAEGGATRWDGRMQMHSKPKPRLLREKWLDLKKSVHKSVVKRASQLGEQSEAVKSALDTLGIEETMDPQQLYTRLLSNHSSLERKEEILIAFGMAKRAREAFDAIGGGGDTIEASMIFNVMRRMGHSRSISTRQAETIVSQLDLSGDHHINFAEFGAFFKRLQECSPSAAEEEDVCDEHAAADGSQAASADEVRPPAEPQSASSACCPPRSQLPSATAPISGWDEEDGDELSVGRLVMDDRDRGINPIVERDTCSTVDSKPRCDTDDTLQSGGGGP